MQLRLQELIFSSSDPETSREISKMEKKGVVRKIAPRIYTSNLEESPAKIIQRNIFQILGNLYPGVILSHRSALEFKPTEDYQIFLTYSYSKKIELPGVTLNFFNGMKPIEGDSKFVGELYASSQERAFLENLQTSRSTGRQPKNLPVEELENKLEKIFLVKGEQGLNDFRDNARKISEKLHMETEFAKLNKIISALLKTRPSNILSSPIAKARVLGEPYDEGRLRLFEKLFVHLKQEIFENVEDNNLSPQSFRNFAFFESYFSNYIEGTVFEIEEAKQIVDSQIPIANRGEDSHDILGTYRLVSNKKEMSIIPASADELVDILSYRHKVLLEARRFKNPGEFKNKNNRAGETYFVDFTMVRGTLKKGFEFYQALRDSFSRAAFIMFLISEIHPFLDGNGRVARIMMNSELVHSGQSRIMIPTVYREDYLGALRRLTRNGDPTVYVKMLQRAQTFSSQLDASDIVNLEMQLVRANAFKESDEAVLRL